MSAARILIVEDERIIAKGIEKRLRALGYEVAGVAGTGEDAVRLAEAERPDVVLMDINLGGGIDGVEASARIRARADVPVIFLTAFSDADTLARAKLTDPHGYVLKPYEDKDLQTAIEIGRHKHAAELRLRENERWLAATLGSIGDGVIATDEAGRVRYVNPLAERLTGWPRADAIGRDVGEVFRTVEEQTRAEPPNPAREALLTGAPTPPTPGALLVARDGTERPIDDSAAPIRDAGGRTAGAVLVFRDVTERRRLEERLRQAQKMEAIGRLAGGIAHDFNNIMTIITGFGDLLVAGAGLTDQQREFVSNIQEAGRRAAGLTQQIMAFSRKQILMPTVLNLNTVVRGIGAMVRRLIGSNIRFETETAADLGLVRADPTQLGQVILNLAANARDAMPGGGRLVIATANAALGPEVTAEHPDVPAGPYVLLSVSDTGTGMPPEVLAHAFEPFFTTKSVGEGTGLGLATVYGVVKQSGGHIAVESAVGAGTTFRVYLPRVEGEPAAAGRGAADRPRGSETILLVEDEDAVRRMTRLVLEREGYTVVEAADGRAALSAAESHAGPIHLLLTDLMMPHQSGRDVADQLRAAGRVSRVLYMSGYTEDVLIYQGLDESANVLHKPFDIAGMLAKVRDVLDRSA
jgi:hypothetical protein